MIKAAPRQVGQKSPFWSSHGYSYPYATVHDPSAKGDAYWEEQRSPKTVSFVLPFSSLPSLFIVIAINSLLSVSEPLGRRHALGNLGKENRDGSKGSVDAMS